MYNLRHNVAVALQASGVPDNEAAALRGYDTATYRRFRLIVDDDGSASVAAVAGRLYAAV